MPLPKLDTKNLMTIKQFLAERPAFTKRQIDHWLHDERKFQLFHTGAAFKFGKKVYIQVDRFDRHMALVSARLKA